MAEAQRDEIAKLEALYAANPEGHVFTHLAEAYRKAGELDHASDILADGLRRHPDSASAYVVLGKVEHDRDDQDAARHAFSQVLSLDRGNLIALRFLGELALDRGDLPEALQHYRELLNRDFTDAALQQKVDDLARSLESAATVPPPASLEAPQQPAPETVSEELSESGEGQERQEGLAQVEELPEVAANQPEPEAEPFEMSSGPGEPLQDLPEPDRAALATPAEAYSEAVSYDLTPVEQADDRETESEPQQLPAESDYVSPDAVSATGEGRAPDYPGPEIQPEWSGPAEPDYRSLEVEAAPAEAAAEPEYFQVEAVPGDLAEPEYLLTEIEPPEVLEPSEPIDIEPPEPLELDALSLNAEPAEGEYLLVEAESGEPGEVEYLSLDQEAEPAEAVEPEYVSLDFEAEPVEGEYASLDFEDEPAESTEAAAVDLDLEAGSVEPAEPEVLEPPVASGVVESEGSHEVVPAAEGDLVLAAAFEAPTEAFPNLEDLTTIGGFQPPAGAAEELPPADVPEAEPPAQQEAGLFTETMADLYRRQGFADRAAEVYRSLLARDADNVRLRILLDQVEAEQEEGARRSPDWLQDVQAVESAFTGAAGAAAGADTPYAWSESAEERVPAGPRIGEYFRNLLAWRPTVIATPAGATPLETTAAASPELLLEEVAGEPVTGSAPEGEVSDLVREETSFTGWSPDELDEPASPPPVRPEPTTDLMPWEFAEPASLAESEGSAGGALPVVPPGEPAKADEPHPATGPATGGLEAEDEDLEMFRSWLQSLKK